jgi:hypothetical protein
MTVALVSILVVAFLGWWLLSLFGPNPPIRVSKQTTYITSPLAADGLPDYVAAIEAELKKGVTPQNNGAVPFLEAMWRDSLSSTQEGYSLDEAKQLAAALGVPLPPPSGARFTARESKAMRKQAKELIESHSGPRNASIDIDDQAYELLEPSRAWTRADLPFLADWVEENAAAYDLLHEAAGRPEWFVPSYLGDGGPRGVMANLNVNAVFFHREAQRCLAVRSLQRLGEGDPEEAAADVVTSLKLATRGWNQDRLLIDDLVSIACAGLGLRQAMHVADAKTTTVGALNAVLKAVQEAEDAIDPARTYDRHERQFSLNTVVDYACGSVPIDEGMLSPTDATVWLVRATSVDWNEVLIVHNEYHDRAAAIWKGSNWSSRWAAATALDRLYDQTKPNWASRLLGGATGRGRELGRELLCLGISPASSMVRAVDSHRMRCQLAALAIASTIHRAQKGAYPDKLDQLVPDVLPALPVDLFHNKPFLYRKTADGFLLYSCGPNGVDDGGSNDTTNEAYSSPQPVLEGVELEDESDPRAKQIPAGADDASVLFPLPIEPWPWEKVASGSPSAGD